MIDIQATAPEDDSTRGEITPPEPEPAQKILFADDEEDLREFIETILLEEGYRIQAATDGYEAVRMFDEFQPDLVILDLNMPLMNGSEVCSFIRQTSSVPIIMFTGGDDMDNVAGAIKNGTTDFVLKSTGIAELAERVAGHLTPKTKTVDTLFEGAVLQVSSSVPAPFTSTTLIVDPNEQHRAHIKAILTRLSQDFVEAGNAVEAVSAFEEFKPDIVITEWSLPDTDAAKLLAYLVDTQNFSQPIAIAMSRPLPPEIQRKLIFAGIDHFLPKPLDLWQAELIIGKCVKRARTQLKRNTSKAAWYNYPENSTKQLPEREGPRANTVLGTAVELDTPAANAG